MYICKECFKDEELRSEVQNAAQEEGVCEVTENSGRLLILDELYDFFMSVIQLYEKSGTGITLAEAIQMDWNLFRDLDVAKIILSDVINNSPDALIQVNDKVKYNSYITNQLNGWEDLKKEVRENSRFFTDPGFLEDIEFNTVSLKKNTRLYRARITPASKTILNKREMGCPEMGLATSGRANPLGIPYLYLCEDKDTTYYEVRSVFLDKLSVGYFRVESDLTIVDFHYDFHIFSAFTDGDENLAVLAARKIVIDAISKDLSKPLRRFDTELEYVPTQYICEYCKQFLDADGICFESSLHKGHINYVLFNPKNAKCTYVSTHEISSVTLS